MISTTSTQVAAGKPAEPEHEFEALAARVDAVIAEVETLEPAARHTAQQLQSAIEAFHKLGLACMVRHLKADPRGKELLLELAAMPEVYALFSMHGLVRVDLHTRVERVLQSVRPYMQSHGGDVELVRVDPDTVFIALRGSCNGCSMSAVTLRNGVEEALREHVPEIKHIEVVPEAQTPALVPLSSVSIRPREGWVSGPAAAELQDGTPFRLESDKGSALILRLGEHLYAYRNACAHQGLPLDGALIDREAGTLTCPWHGFSYDCATGECLTAAQAQLEQLPLRVENGVVKVRLL